MTLLILPANFSPSVYRLSSEGVLTNSRAPVGDTSQYREKKEEKEEERKARIAVLRVFATRYLRARALDRPFREAEFTFRVPRG